MRCNTLPKLLLGDCLEVMKDIPDGSVDMVLADLPYGTTRCKWDSIIPMDALWAEYLRVIKPARAIVLFGSEPFSSKLRMSRPDLFKYDWVWAKNTKTGFLNAGTMPLRQHETISVFSTGSVRASMPSGKMSYFPQGTVPADFENRRKHVGAAMGDSKRSGGSDFNAYTQKTTNYPTSILYFKAQPKPVHPTQKPVALLEYLINTYSLEGETVLDNTMGSGSTGVACANTGRQFIGIEKEPKYFELAEKRVFTAFPPFVKQVAINEPAPTKDSCPYQVHDTLHQLCYTVTDTAPADGASAWTCYCQGYFCVGDCDPEDGNEG